MYTLKGVFPEPKKPHQKNFVRENARQCRMSSKTSVEPSLKSGRDSRANEPLVSIKSSSSNKSGKATYTVPKSANAMRKKPSPEIKFKKGDMAEFLKRKELRSKPPSKLVDSSPSDTNSTSHLRDVACQTIESSLSQKLADQRLTVLYPKEEGAAVAKQKASGDSSRRDKTPSPNRLQNGHKGDERESDHLESDRKVQDSERKKVIKPKPVEKDKDPYLPAGYQKGILPKYLRDRRDDMGPSGPEHIDAECPPGHVALPDTERKETLRMLRNSFAELVNELNKMPVRTDTLRMRARKMELEKQLSKLEEGIKVFSRPKVFVRIGE